MEERMSDTNTSRLVDSVTHEGEDLGDRSLRPKLFHEVIGQSELVDNLKVFVRAAKERAEALDHVLLAGPPGLGKTTLANVLANELGVELHKTSGPALEKKDLAGILSHIRENDVLFIDEIHRLSPAVEENLYPAMEDFKFDLILGQGPQARTIEMPLPRFTLVGATTKTGLLTGPMRDRFGFIGRVQYYGHQALQEVVTRSAVLLGVPCELDGAAEIASRSRGTPRIANRLLRRVRDFAEVEGTGAIEVDLARYALERLGVDENGFDSLDRKFLDALVHQFSGGPVGVDTLASAIGEETETLESVVEPYLIQEGFVQRTPRGRIATQHAFLYLGIKPPEEKKRGPARSGDAQTPELFGRDD